jgi:hypothetical protein
VSVPSANLDAYGIEIAASSFCMNVQRRYFDRDTQGAAWTPAVGLDDILVMSTHAFRDEADGTTSILPGTEVLYSAAIVEALKQQVEVPGLVNGGQKCIVSVCDPNGQLAPQFGWLPVIVTIHYAEPVDFSRRITVLTITPSYVGSGNRAVVTGFTVLDKLHWMYRGASSEQRPGYWDAWLTGGHIASSGADQRYNQPGQHVLYYLDGNKLDVYVDPAVQTAAYSNVVGVGAQLHYENRNTQRWTSANPAATQVNVMPYAVTPDNGITPTWLYQESTGAAGIIAKGAVNNPLLASVYPEIGWVIFFQAPTDAVFQGKPYTFPAGLIDLRDIDAAPGNKTFYVYATLVSGKPTYQVTTQKRLETLTQLWAATVKTNGSQIISVERLNVFALNGHRITEVKRGNSIPGASGLVNEEGQIPWFYPSEILP